MPTRRFSHEELAEHVDLYLMLGRMLFQCGATTQRIIDSIQHLHDHLGTEEIHVLVSYDAILITTTSGENFRTKIDQSRSFASVNITQLMEISRYLRGLKDRELNVSGVRGELERIRSMKGNFKLIPLLVAAGLTNVGFGFLNGGDTAALSIVFFSAIVIFMARHLLLGRGMNLYPATLLAVIAGGLVASAATRCGVTATPIAAFVCPILFLIPGTPMINGGMDVLRNHNAVGLSRMAFTIFMVLTISMGLAGAMAIIPLPTPTSHNIPLGLPLSVLLDGLFGAVAASGLAILTNAPWRTIPLFAVCGAASRLVRTGMVALGIDPVASALMGTIACTIIAVLISQRSMVPRITLAVTGVLTLVPGFFIIRGLKGLFLLSRTMGNPPPGAEIVMTLQCVLAALFISVALIVGILFPLMILDRLNQRI